MAANINNFSSVPTSAVISVQNFAETPCPICQNMNLENAEGTPLKLVACSHLNSEGIPDHVVHAKCLRTWIKHLQNLGQAMPFGFVKCFHCQILLDQTGIKNEVFEQKGLFARTQKLITKASEEKFLPIAIATLFRNAPNDLQSSLMALIIVSMTGFFTLQGASVIWNEAADLLNWPKRTGEALYPSNYALIIMYFGFTVSAVLIELKKYGKNADLEIIRDFLKPLIILAWYLYFTRINL